MMDPNEGNNVGGNGNKGNVDDVELITIDDNLENSSASEIIRQVKGDSLRPTLISTDSKEKKERFTIRRLKSEGRAPLKPGSENKIQVDEWNRLALLIHPKESSRLFDYEEFFDPLIRNKLLLRISSTRAYTVSVLLCLTYVLVLYFFRPKNGFSSNEPFNIVFETSPSIGLVYMLFLLSVEATRTEKRVITCLLTNFEYWYLLMNVVGTVVAVLYAAIHQQNVMGVPFFEGPREVFHRIVYTILYFLVSVYALSMDAMPHLRRWQKSGLFFCWTVHGAMDLINEKVLSTEYTGPDFGPVFYNLSTRRVYSLCMMTLCIYYVKYFVFSVIKPHQLVCLSIPLEHYIKLRSIVTEVEKVQKEKEEKGKEETPDAKPISISDISNTSRQTNTL